MKSMKASLRAALAALAFPLIVLGSAAGAHAQSGALTVYASQATARNVVELFEKEYPEIDVTLLHMVTGPLAARFSNEAASGVNAADVLLIALGRPHVLTPVTTSHL